MAIDELFAEWELRPDGAALTSAAATVLPVRTRSGQSAVLKVSTRPREHEHLALVRWDGDGAARLLRADPRRGALLLEALPGGDLTGLEDQEACEIVAALYPRLHRPVGAPLPRLSAWAADRAEALAALPRNAPVPHRLAEQAAALARGFASDDATDGVLVHGNLHYAHVLRSGSGWAAVSPAPFSGDPYVEVAPLLWNRFEELAGDVRNGLRRRFHATIDAAGFDEDRARDWVVVRAVARALESDAAGLTRCIAVAKAVQD